ncbi:MAG: DUF4193 family protein [Acidimicrobiales bacterium]
MTNELDDIEEPEDIDEEALRSELGDVIDEDIEIDLDDDSLVDDDLAGEDLDDDHDLSADEPLEEVDLAADIDGVAKKDPVSLLPGDVQPGLTEDEDDEEPRTDDVEEALDMILRNRLVTEEYEGNEDDEDDIGDGSPHVLPKQPGEFVCKSCFLVKNANQLADPKRSLCKDCV